MTADDLELYTPYIVDLEDFVRVNKKAPSIKLFMPTEIDLYQQSWGSMSMRGVFVHHGHNVRTSGLWNLEKRDVQQYREMTAQDIDDYGFLIVKGIFELGAKLKL